ncbi:hypothetical protein ASZ90_014313 [hydrocarbon metagenome]|uniref:Uncharacterized protein n=1 Tax=hydrocarbon metagenome TaxID=938273 RepID=A0A0W8F5G7_9ZZZZ
MEPTRRKETIDSSTIRNLVRRPMESRLTRGQKNSSKRVKMFLFEITQFL